jgi:hypothetical protein
MNELRTLRMEYEVFNRIRTTFADEIAANREAGGLAFGWSDIAGLADWDNSNPQRNSRMGSEQSFEEWASGSGYAPTSTVGLYNPLLVLQQFNASSADEDDRLVLLNTWLEYNELPKIEEWPPSGHSPFERRSSNLEWIPTGTLFGTLVPRDAPCRARGCVRRQP